MALDLPSMVHVTALNRDSTDEGGHEERIPQHARFIEAFHASKPHCVEAVMTSSENSTLPGPPQLSWSDLDREVTL